MTDLAVHDVRLFPKCPLDGTTATSADLELPGPVRTLAWAGVIDDAAPFGVHILIDSDDVPGCATVALRIAPRHLGRSLTSGIWFVTTSRIEAATIGTYPVPARAVLGTQLVDERSPRCSESRRGTPRLRSAGEGELRSVQPAIPRGLGLLGSTWVGSLQERLVVST